MSNEHIRVAFSCSQYYLYIEFTNLGGLHSKTLSHDHENNLKKEQRKTISHLVRK